MDTPTINEFIAHPDYQQVASFFLGAVFITSLNYSCLRIRSFVPRFRKWISRVRSTTTDIENVSSEKVSITSSLEFGRPGENQCFLFTLSLCFAFASIAYFGSLLSFSTNGGATCAFVVAWGGMAAQTARLIGLLMLLLELRDLGIAKLEFYTTLAFLFVAMVLLFVNNAVGTGTIRPFPPLAIAVCYRRHFLPTALTTSFMHLFLELFILLRLGFFITRQSTPASQRLISLRDGRIVKATSLLFLELLTIAPSAIRISLLADFIPLSIGALAVLVAFNHRSTARDSHPMLNSDAVSPISVAPVPPRGRAGWFSRRSFRSSFGSNNPTRALRSPEPIQPAAATMPHPFSSQYLNNTRLAWPRENQQQATRLSTQETFSTHESVIQTVARSATSARARAVIVPPESMPKTSLQRPPDVSPPLALGPVTSAEPQAPTPAAHTPSLSPTSILMHPWHERRQPDSTLPTSRFSVDGSEESKGIRSPTSSKRGSDRMSYMFPIPPVPSSAGPMRRYSSVTLTSPMLSEEGGQPRKHVQLLAFESNFRTNGENIAYHTPLPSSVDRR